MNSPGTTKLAIPQRGAAVLRIESPFPEYALPRVWTWIRTFRQRISDDTAPKTLEAFIADWEKVRGQRHSWGVWRGEDLGGLVVAEVSEVGVAVCHALFKPEFRGGAAVQNAVGKIAAELFSSGVRKIMHSTYRGNDGMIALFKSLGAKIEGTLRRHTLRDGRPLDVVVLGLFKEDLDKWASGTRSQKSVGSPRPPSLEAPASGLPPASPASAPSAAP